MDQGWQKLARLIRADAPALYKNNRELAIAAEVSVSTIESLKAGRRTSYRDVTLHGIEAALGWEHDSARAVVGGRQVVRQTDRALARVQDAWPHLSVRDRRIVLALVAALRK